MKTLLMICVALSGMMALAQTTQSPEEAVTQPTTQPSAAPAQANQPTPVDAEGALDRLLRARPGTAQPIQPVAPADASETRQPRNDVAPRTPSVALKREGDIIVERVGRLHPVAGGFEFRFESDRRQLSDPPMTILPSQRLADMEGVLNRSGGDLRFKVTGLVTQYRGKNYLLIEKAAEVVTDHEGL